MSGGALLKVIIGVLIVLAIMCLLAGFMYLEHKLLWSRGYGMITRPLPPDVIAVTTFVRPVNEFLNEYSKNTDGKLPDAKDIAANVPKIILDENQPYANFNIYILTSEITKQKY